MKLLLRIFSILEHLSGVLDNFINCQYVFTSFNVKSSNSIGVIWRQLVFIIFVALTTINGQSGSICDFDNVLI